MGDANYPPKLSEEIARLKELDVPWSATLLVSSMDPVESTSAAREIQGNQLDDSTSATHGYWVGAKGVLIPGDGEDDLAKQLKDQVATAENDESITELLELWITAEPTLSGAQLDELRPLVFGRVFGDFEEKLSRSHNSDSAQGGGY
ncbi:hypothetical protein [Streptomyces sp. NPDC057877]|uniref:hypothetical protein n=1 Tax=Streptomyces sp. NPDC057877 TaxID=3346269 RepID=UPI003678839F